eukprot:m.8011 g.8011  ORF g.8011 m.8011 type:complete len:517 (+) comp2495_c0_seq1:264-1814(+)
MFVSPFKRAVRWLSTQPMAAETKAIRADGLRTSDLVGVMFFFCCGGPMGIESIVGEAGPLVCLLGIALIPFVWCIPMGLMSAELATAIPADGANVLWVDRALGPHIGFVNGVVRLVAGMVDLALYPIIAVEYLGSVLPESISQDDLNSYLFGLLLVLICWILNVLGVEAVGTSAIVLTCLILIPLIVFVILCLPDVRVSEWSVVPDETAPDLGVNWANFLSTILWATAGFDDAGSFAGSVRDPAHSYVRALAITVLLAMMTYILPIAAGVCVLPWQEWHVGAFKVAAETRGHWLSVWIAFAALVSGIGSFNALLCADAFMLKAMAKMRWFPAVFEYTLPTLETPVVGITLVCVVAALAGMLDFHYILKVETSLLAMSTICEFVACVVLRYTEPDLPRPFVIPVPNALLILLFFPPVCLSIFCICTVFVDEWPIMIVSAALIAVSSSVYMVRRACGTMPIISHRDDDIDDAIRVEEDENGRWSPNSLYNERNPLLEVQRLAGGLQTRRTRTRDYMTV